jgi:hypothetical protein
MSVRTDFVDVLDERLDAMLARPGMWGGAEAVELQVLLLLELRIVAMRPAFRNRAMELLKGQYSSFLQRRFPDAGPRMLSALAADPHELASLLEQLRTEVLDSVAAIDGEMLVGTTPIAAPPSLGEDVVIALPSTVSGPMPRRERDGART